MMRQYVIFLHIIIALNKNIKIEIKTVDVDHDV